VRTRHLSPAELEAVRGQLYEAVADIAGDDRTSEDFRTGLMVLAGLFCGFAIDTLAAFTQLPADYVRPRVAALRVSNIVTGNRTSILHPLIRRRMEADGHPEMLVRVGLLSLVAQGVATYDLEGDAFCVNRSTPNTNSQKEV